MARNITLAVDDDVLNRFRDLAAGRKTSINALVREFMEDAVGIGEERRKASICRMIELAESTALAELAPAWNRDELWDRDGR